MPKVIKVEGDCRNCPIGFLGANRCEVCKKAIDDFSVSRQLGEVFDYAKVMKNCPLPDWPEVDKEQIRKLTILIQGGDPEWQETQDIHCKFCPFHRRNYPGGGER